MSPTRIWWLAPLALWAALGLVLQSLTTRMVDWYYMTDELLYERLAISVARTGSPLPALRGHLVPLVDQLFPLLIAVVYRHGFVPHDLHEAHALDAWVMSSASIPAFLLARRVTLNRWAGVFVAVLSVCVPWIVYATFLLTEVVAYPAFLWAMLALQATTANPSRRNDVLAVVAIAAAVFARTQFLSLLVVVPVALLLVDGRGVHRRHPVLAWGYGLLLALAVFLIASGHAADVLGIYGESVHGHVLSTGLGRALADHAGVLALGLGLVPFVAGGAWLLRTIVRRDERRELHAFAAVALASIAMVVVEGAFFDERYGGVVVRDRYLFYAGPLVLVAFCCALVEPRRLGWWLLGPAALVVLGLAVAPIPDYGRLDVGSPVAVVIVYVGDSLHSAVGARIFLAAAAVIATLLFVEGASLLSRRALVIVVGLLVLLALPAETAYAFAQLFRHNGTAGRPVTVQQGGVFDWVDRTLGTRGDVTMVPYPTLETDLGASMSFWWDLEFWNKSVTRDAHYRGQFVGTPSTFPKLALAFDPRTGRANISPTRYVAQYQTDSRFRVSGTAVSQTRSTLLIDAAEPWRTDWLTFGLYDDGWTRPKHAAVIRVFAEPGQKGPVTRYLALGVQASWAPVLVARRPFQVVSNLQRWRGVANGTNRVENSVAVCVPAHGFTDVHVGTDGRGDRTDADQRLRRVGVLLTEIDLADEVGPPCKAIPPA